jgi:hypothetical protein
MDVRLEWAASKRDCVYFFLAEQSPQGSLARRAKRRGSADV